MKLNKVILNEMWRAFSRDEKPTNEQLEALFDEAYWALQAREKMSDMIDEISDQLVGAS